MDTEHAEKHGETQRFLRKLAAMAQLKVNTERHRVLLKFFFSEPQRHKGHKDFLSGFLAFLSVLCVFVVEYFGCLPVADRPATLRCELRASQ